MSHDHVSKSRSFVSKADTRELREYQTLASKYPPLPHERLISLSKRFISGRDAAIAIEEYRLVDSVVSGNWSEESLREHEAKVKQAFSDQISLMSEEVSSLDLLSAILPEDERTQADLYRRRFANILGDYPWMPQISIASATGFFGRADAALVPADALSKTLEALDAVLPHDVPKDILDRWKEDASHLSGRYLATVKPMMLSERDIRRKRVLAGRADSALEEMVNHNLQLAMSRVGKFMKGNPRAQKIGVDDLICAANVGLVLGARQFDPSKERKFSTYAAFHIDAQLYDIISNEDGNCGIQGISRHEQKQASTINAVNRTFVQRYGRSPSLFELQSITGISAPLIMKRQNMTVVSTQNLDAPLANSGPKNDDSENSALIDVLPSNQDVETVIDGAVYDGMLDALKHEIFNLPLKYREAVLLRSGIVADETAQMKRQPMSMTKVAAEMGVSTKTAEETYRFAMELLRGKMELRGFDKDMILP